MNLASISGTEFVYPQNSPQTLAAYIESVVKFYPEGKFSVIDAEGLLHTRSYSETYAQAMQILLVLNRKNIKTGTTLILCFDDVLDFIPAAWASIAGGYQWIPWSTMELRRNQQGFVSGFEVLVEKFDQPWILSSSATRLWETLERIIPEQIQRFDIHMLKFSQALPENEIPFINAYAKQGECIVSTSGTTGQPKLAHILHSTLLNRLYRPTNSDSQRDVIYCYCFPLHSISGMAVICPITAHTVYFHPNRFASHPQDLLRCMETTRAHWFGLSSYMATMLINAIDRSNIQCNLTSLQGITFGADFIVPTVVKKLLARLENLGAKNLDLSLVYGMTECGPICRFDVTQAQFLEQFKEDTLQAEVGGCTTGRSLRIVDESETIVYENQIGDIQIYAPAHIFSGYYGDDELTKNSFTNDSWFKTGDMGFIKDGKLTITGRKKNKIVINGKNFSLEQIEASLANISGIKIIIATALRTEHSISDELAVFFIPESFEEQALIKVTDAIVQRLAGDMSIKYLIPMTENDLEQTSTGKIRSELLVEKYKRGELTAFVLKKNTPHQQQHNKLQDYLITVWQAILKSENAPLLDDNFFHLGADSLAVATLIAEVENKFNCHLPLTTFYKKPTLANLIDILNNFKAQETLQKNAQQAQTSPELPIEQLRLTDAQLLHKMESYVGRWEGERQFEGSLVVGMNTKGTKTPIFWVFQDYQELRQLVQHLGSEQPLYGMRSYVNILKVKEYTADAVETLVNRYLWEILALPVNHPVILGGNCQGAIIALALAKALKRIGKVPACLVLMEWSFSFGVYPEPVLFLYGEQSYTAKIYTEPQYSQINWQNDFPNHSVAAILGSHGEFFKEPNIQSLAKVLTTHIQEML